MSKKFKIPQVLRTGSKDIGDEAVIATFQAADKHAKHLEKARYEISVAIDLAATLRAFLTSDTNDARIDESMTADTIVELIENHMRKIRDRLETHSSRHTNLFFAYFDLKAAGGAS